MSVTQYIGARYVPKFYENSLGTSEWQRGVIYEPLTIVTYNGNSYTSKKPVPASVDNPSDNNAYWVATGNYNEQINELANKIDGMYNYDTTVMHELDNSGDVDNSTAFASIEDNVGLKKGTYLISTNCVINANLFIPDGALILIASGVTVRFNGYITAGRYQIISCAENACVLSGNSVIYPEWFGAKNDGVTDSTNAFKIAISAMVRGYISLAQGTQYKGSTYWEGGDRSYVVSSTIEFNKAFCGIGAEGASAVIFSTSALPIFRFGSGSTDNTLQLERITAENITFVSGYTGNLDSLTISSNQSYAVNIIGSQGGTYNRLRVIGTCWGYFMANNTGNVYDRCTITPSASYSRGCGFYVDGNYRNWSNRWRDCSVSMNATDAYGLYMSGAVSVRDSFFDNFETANTGIGVYINALTGSGFNNILFNNAIIDQCKKSCVIIEGAVTNGYVRFVNSYFQRQMETGYNDGAIINNISGAVCTVQFENCEFADSAYAYPTIANKNGLTKVLNSKFRNVGKVALVTAGGFDMQACEVTNASGSLDLGSIIEYNSTYAYSNICYNLFNNRAGTLSTSDGCIHLTAGNTAIVGNVFAGYLTPYLSSGSPSYASLIMNRQTTDQNKLPGFTHA